MECNVCSSRMATIHIQEVINGNHRSLHLCAECAAERQLGQEALKDFTLADFLSNFAGLAGDLAPEENAPEYPDITCSSCGVTTAEFQESGVFGCPDCYDSFAEILDEILPLMHRDTHFDGKVPGQAETVTLAPVANGQAVDLQAAVLQRELDDAIAVEHYERAAALRDELQKLDRSSEVS